MKNPSSNILLIYTGGTIGMFKEKGSKSLKPFNFDQILAKIPELKLLDHKIDTISFEKPLDSSDFGVKEYQKLADIIYNNYALYDGFVVLHGSDTMSYTASVISFMLENLSKPVIFTGSQLPIGDLRTDAKENLITSIQIAGLKQNNKPVIAEVGLYFEYKLYRGNRTSKINAEHFEAFESPNYPPLTESGVHLNINENFIIKHNKRKQLILHKALEDKILLLKLFPGLSKDLFTHLLNISDIKGIIIETFGSGNYKTEEWFVDALKAKIDKQIPVVNITQCIGGQVQMGKYQSSEKLEKIGVISGNDITTESAIAKMMFLLPKKLNISVFKTIFETSLRGEITEQ